MPENQLILYALLEVGVPLNNIRRAFPKLTGIKQSQLAKKAQRSPETINRYLNGHLKHEPVLRSIAGMFGVQPELFFQDVWEERSDYKTPEYPF
jgi:transcriptional regulator with XRE-family HTH domain